MKRLGRILRIAGVMAGLMLVFAGVFGIIYSLRVARSQSLYHSIKYGTFSDAGPAEVADLCAAAHEIYPQNYYLCIEAVDRLWGSDAAGAALWCERGLALNPYHRVLRRANTQLLAKESPADAADYWSEFVDWQFWSARNQAFLVECLAKAGRLAEAAEHLTLIKGREGYDRAEAALKRAWAAEMKR
jgi:hypothetical protein